MFSRLAVALVVLSVLCGCASHPTTAGSSHAAPSKPIVIVRDFGLQSATVHTKEDGVARQNFLQDTVAVARDTVIERIGIEGEARKAEVSLPKQGWLVDGDFHEIVDKSYLRYMMGFSRTGVGVSARIRLFDLSLSSRVPVASFDVPSSKERLSPDKVHRVVSIQQLADAVLAKWREALLKAEEKL